LEDKLLYEAQSADKCASVPSKEQTVRLVLDHTG